MTFEQQAAEWAIFRARLVAAGAQLADFGAHAMLQAACVGRINGLDRAEFEGIAGKYFEKVGEAPDLAPGAKA